MCSCLPKVRHGSPVFLRPNDALSAPVRLLQGHSPLHLLGATVHPAVPAQVQKILSRTPTDSGEKTSLMEDLRSKSWADLCTKLSVESIVDVVSHGTPDFFPQIHLFKTQPTTNTSNLCVRSVRSDADRPVLQQATLARGAAVAFHDEGHVLEDRGP